VVSSEVGSIGVVPGRLIRPVRAGPRPTAQGMPRGRCGSGRIRGAAPEVQRRRASTKSWWRAIAFCPVGAIV